MPAEGPLVVEGKGRQTHPSARTASTFTINPNLQKSRNPDPRTPTREPRTLTPNPTGSWQSTWDRKTLNPNSKTLIPKPQPPNPNP